MASETPTKPQATANFQGLEVMGVCLCVSKNFKFPFACVFLCLKTPNTQLKYKPLEVLKDDKSFSADLQ